MVLNSLQSMHRFIDIYIFFFFWGGVVGRGHLEKGGTEEKDYMSFKRPNSIALLSKDK